MEAISDVISHKCAGGGGEFFEDGEKGVVEHDLDFYSAEDEESELNVTAGLDETIVLEVERLVSHEIKPEHGAQIRAKEVIPFVVLKFNPERDRHWTVPEPNIFHDLINRVEGVIVEENLDCDRVCLWGNMWGKVGLLGLSPKYPDLINQYRVLVEGQILGKTRFTIFPRDALEKKGTVTVLLREQFRSFKTEWLPKSILRRTRKLRGGLRLTHTKTYADTDVSRAGANKKGWRLALLQGCPRFMMSLEQFPQDHRFPVGSGHVLIRGGSNRPKGQGPGQDRGRGRGRGLDRDGRRSGPSAAPKAPGHQQQQQGQQQQQNESRSNTNNYDRRFPTGGLVPVTSMGRGRGTSDWSSPGLPGTRPGR